jgi:hypothetical protein
MMRYLLIVLSLALAACGGKSTGSTEPGGAAGSGAAAVGDPACPAAVPGTSVSVEDTDTGAALVFVTTGDVADLRARAAAMAKAHADAHGAMGPLPTGDETDGGGHHHHAGMEHGDAGGGHAMHAMDGTMVATHSNARAEDIEGGARVVYIAAPAQVAALRDELRMHAPHFASGSCSMKGM